MSPVTELEPRDTRCSICKSTVQWLTMTVFSRSSTVVLMLQACVCLSSVRNVLWLNGAS